MLSIFTFLSIVLGPLIALFLIIQAYELIRKLQYPIVIGQKWILKRDMPHPSNKSPWAVMEKIEDPCIVVVYDYKKGWLKTRFIYKYGDTFSDGLGYEYRKESAFRDIFAPYKED